MNKKISFALAFIFYDVIIQNDMKKLIVIALILCLQQNSFAQDLYKVRYKESKIEWKGFKPFGEHNGWLSFINGAIYFTNDDIISASFITDMRSIFVMDIKEQEEKDALMKDLNQASFLNTKDYSMALFELTEAKKINEGVNNYQFTGNLTIKDITRPITFPAQIRIAGNKLVGKAKVVFDRQEWNLEMESFVKELALYNDIELNIYLVAYKK